MAVLVGVLAVAFAPFFLTGRIPFGGDLLTLNYPLFSMMHRALTSGVVPLWEPYSGGGYPLAPFSALVAYPVAWLVLFLPPTAALGWTYCTDYLVAGVFMLLLTRRLGCSLYGGLVAALGFTLSGFMVAHLYAGHVLELGVIAWMPATFYATHSALATGRRRYVVLGGLFLGLQILANGVEFLPFVLYPLVFAGAWTSCQMIRRTRGGPVAMARFIARAARGLLGAGAIAAGLSAILTLPFLQVLGHTVRDAGVPFADATHLSLPLTALGMLTVPGLFGNSANDSYWLAPGQHLYFHELYAYVGLVPLVLALWAWAGARRAPTTMLYSAVAVVGTLLALGKNTPLYAPIYALLPGMTLIRVPGRWLLVVTFAIAILAAHGVDVFLSRTYSRRHALRWLLGIAAAIFLVSLGPLVAAAHLSPASFWNVVVPAVVRLGIVLAIVSGLVLRHAAGKVKARMMGAALVALTLLDLASANAPLLTFMNPGPYFARADVAAFLHAHPGDYRVLSLDYSLPLRMGMIDGLTRDVQDYAPMTLATYWVYTHAHEVHDLTKVNVSQARDIFYSYDAAVTRLLGVRYVFSDHPLKGPNLRPAGHFRALHWQIPHAGSWNVHPWRVDTYAYRDAAALPAVVFAPRWQGTANDREARALSRRGDLNLSSLALISAPPAPSPWARIPLVSQVQQAWANWLAVHDRLTTATSVGGWRLRTGQNSVSLAGHAPVAGYLVLDDLSYPGWTATVDDRPATIQRADYLLQSVFLTPGYHRVRFVYAPLSFLSGFLITLGTTLLLILGGGYWLWRGRRRRMAAHGLWDPRPAPRVAPA